MNIVISYINIQILIIFFHIYFNKNTIMKTSKINNKKKNTNAIDIYAGYVSMNT